MTILTIVMIIAIAYMVIASLALFLKHFSGVIKIIIYAILAFIAFAVMFGFIEYFAEMILSM